MLSHQETDIRCNAKGVEGRHHQCVQVFGLTVHGESWGFEGNCGIHPSLALGGGTAVYQCSVCGAFVLTLYQDKTCNACVLQLFIKKKLLPLCSSKFFGSSVPGGDLHITPAGNTDPGQGQLLLPPHPRDTPRPGAALIQHWQLSQAG